MKNAATTLKLHQSNNNNNNNRMLTAKLKQHMFDFQTIFFPLLICFVRLKDIIF